MLIYALAFTLGQLHQRSAAILLSYKAKGGTAQGLELDALVSLDPIVRSTAFAKDAVGAEPGLGLLTRLRLCL